MDDKAADRARPVRPGRARRRRGRRSSSTSATTWAAPRSSLDETGAVTNREEFTPYGETSFGSFARKRYRFTGKERDEESGLNYHSARYLHPALGRWTSCDPIGPAQSANLFRYCLSSPLGATDPVGQESKRSASEAMHNVDSNRNGQISMAEVAGYWNNTRPDAAVSNLLAIPESKFAPDAARLMYLLTAEPAPQQSEWARDHSYRTNQHGMGEGEGRTGAEQDAIADDELHPSRRALRNGVSGVLLLATVVAPEAMAAAAILASDKPLETAGQIAIGGALFGIAGAAASEFAGSSSVLGLGGRGRAATTGGRGGGRTEPPGGAVVDPIGDDAATTARVPAKKNADLRERVAGYRISRTGRLVGDTYEVTIDGLYGDISAKGKFLGRRGELLEFLMGEARSYGASYLRITTNSAVGKGTSKITANHARLMGFPEFCSDGPGQFSMRRPVTPAPLPPGVRLR